MKSLRLHAIGQLSLDDLPTPIPGPGEVRVRVAFCGVCGSDIPRIFSKGTYHFPTAPGHEFAGTVDALGPGVSTVSPGDRVAVFPLLWCGNCGPCERGQYVMCENYDYLGSRRDGAFADFVIAPVRNLLKVPGNVPLDIAAMTEPASVALHALRRTGSVAARSVAIFGAGPIGLMCALWARSMGAATIALFDLAEGKLALARKLGFTHAFNSASTSGKQASELLTAGRGFSLTLDGAGVPATLLEAARNTARGGDCVLLGNPSAGVTFPPDLLSQLMRREVRLLGTWNSSYSHLSDDDDWHATLAAMSAGTLPLADLITHRVPLVHAIDALNDIRAAKTPSCKVLLHP
jgi:L-iditol 2-dehydrogenase